MFTKEKKSFKLLILRCAVFYSLQSIHMLLNKSCFSYVDAIFGKRVGMVITARHSFEYRYNKRSIPNSQLSFIYKYRKM